MEGLLALSRTIDRINEFIGRWISWLILLAILVSAGNAVIRKVFDTSSNAWLELQWYLFGAAFMLAAAYTLNQNDHIRIDIVYGRFPRRVAVKTWRVIRAAARFARPGRALASCTTIGNRRRRAAR